MNEFPAWLTSTLASNATEGRGVLPPWIASLKRDARVVGPAFVALMSQDDNLSVREAIKASPPPGSVLVVAGGSTSRTATTGGLMALEMQQAGIVALVTDGLVRDAGEIRQMRQIFSDEHRVQSYLDIEAALARVQARLGLIPQRAADEITAKCTLDIIDMAKIKSQTELIGYPVLPVVQQLVAACADNLGQYSHWGATTQDITDTATILQIRQALALIEEDLAAVSGHLADLARRYRATPMAGRSNLQQAVPITFGYKVATWLAAIERHRQRLVELRPRVLVGEFGGAAGTLDSLGAHGLDVQEEQMVELGLGQPET